MNSLNTELLTDLVDRKLHLLLEIKHLTIEQMRLIEQDEVDALLAILNRKREAMDGLNFVQNELRPFQSQSPEDRKWKDDKTREACRGKVEQCDRLLAELIAMENSAVQTLSQERELVSQKLHAMQSSATIDRVYQNNSVDESDDEPSSCLSIEG